jgi:hypothetical protein
VGLWLLPARRTSERRTTWPSTGVPGTIGRRWIIDPLDGYRSRQARQIPAILPVDTRGFA